MQNIIDSLDAQIHSSVVAEVSTHSKHVEIDGKDIDFSERLLVLGRTIILFCILLTSPLWYLFHLRLPPWCLLTLMFLLMMKLAI